VTKFSHPKSKKIKQRLLKHKGPHKLLNVLLVTAFSSLQFLTLFCFIPSKLEVEITVTKLQTQCNDVHIEVTMMQMHVVCDDHLISFV